MTVPPGYFDNDPLSDYPFDVQKMARQLQQYQIPLPVGSALRDKKIQMAIEAAGTDPNWSASTYNARQKFLNDYRAGMMNKNKIAINTAIGHIAELDHAAKALHNWSFPFAPLANGIANKYDDLSGHNGRQNDFRQATTAVSDELENAFRGGAGGTEKGIENWRQNIDINATPEGLKGTTHGAVKLLGGRLNAIREAYKEAMGRYPDQPILNPQSRAILRGMGYDPDDLNSLMGIKVAPQDQNAPPQNPPAAPQQTTTPQQGQPSGPPDFNSFFRK